MPNFKSNITPSKNRWGGDIKEKHYIVKHYNFFYFLTLTIFGLSLMITLNVVLLTANIISLKTSTWHVTPMAQV